MFDNEKMTGSERRLMEEKIKVVSAMENDITDDEIDAIKQSAYEDYLNTQNYRQQKAQRKEKRKTIAKRLVAVSAFAIVLFVAPFVYSFLMPVTMSKADHFMRNAAIWINEQFHLNIEFTVPVDNSSNVQAPAQSSFQTIEELAEHTQSSIVYLPTDETIRLDCITYDNTIQGCEQISIQYKINNDDIINIYLSPIDKESATRFEDHVIQYKTAIGSLYIWSNEDGSRAISYVDSYKIDIYSSLSQNSFLDCCNSLTYIN